MLSIGLNTFILSRGNHRVQVGSSQSGTIRRLGGLAYVLHKFDVTLVTLTWGQLGAKVFHNVIPFLKCNEMTPQLLGDSKILKDATEDGAVAPIKACSPTGNRNIRYETKKIKIKIQLIDSYSCQCKTKTQSNST